MMIRRILLSPVYIILMLLRIIVDLAMHLSAWLFYLLGGIFLLTTICSYYMQLETAEGLRHMLIGTGMMFILPQAVSVLSGLLEVAAEIIGDLMRSA